MPYRVTIGAEKNAFLQLFFNELPFFISYISYVKFFFAMIDVVKLKSCLISLPTTIGTFSA